MEPATPESTVSPVLIAIDPLSAWLDVPDLISIAPDEPPRPASCEEILTCPLLDVDPPWPL